MVSTDEDGDTLGNAERKAVAEADEWLKHNQPIPHEDVLAEFGLTMADWEKMGKGPLPLENAALEPAAEDRRALTASRDYFRQNPEGGIPFEQVVAECGFTMDQVRRHQGE